MKNLKKYSVLIAMIMLSFNFMSCQKEDISSDNDQSLNPLLSYMRVDYFIYNGHVYSVEDYPELFEEFGGYFFYYDNENEVCPHGYWPNGDPFYRPPYDTALFESIAPNTNSTYLGNYVRNTIEDIMNAASQTDIQAIVANNMNISYNPLVSLSAVIDETTLGQIANGNIIVSTVTKTVSATNDYVTFNYVIQLLNSAFEYLNSLSINFTYVRDIEEEED